MVHFWWEWLKFSDLYTPAYKNWKGAPQDHVFRIDTYTLHTFYLIGTHEEMIHLLHIHCSQKVDLYGPLGQKKRRHLQITIHALL